MTPNELADKIERVTERAGSTDYVRLDAECWGMVTKALRSSEASERDAARYRWLRKQHWSYNSMCVVERPQKNVRLGANCPSLELLDAAIDAAMRSPVSDERSSGDEQR